MIRFAVYRHHTLSTVIATQLYLIFLGLTVLDIGERNFKGIMLPNLKI